MRGATQLRQALSQTEGQNQLAGSRARCYSQVIRDCWAMVPGVVNLNLEVGGTSTVW